MAEKRWRVDEHDLVLEWSYWGGKREVTVDGEVVAQNQIPMRGWSEQRFELDGKVAVVRTKPSFAVSAKFVVTLEVDGREVAPAEGRSQWESSKSL